MRLTLAVAAVAVVATPVAAADPSVAAPADGFLAALNEGDIWSGPPPRPGP